MSETATAATVPARSARLVPSYRHADLLTIAEVVVWTRSIKSCAVASFLSKRRRSVKSIFDIER